MGESLYYTIYTLKDYRKVGILTAIFYLLSLTFFIPNLSVMTLLIGLLLLFSASSFFVYLSNRTTGLENYIYNLKNQSLWATFLHCLPSAVALLFSVVVVGGVALLLYLYIQDFQLMNNWPRSLLYFITHRPRLFTFFTTLLLLYTFIISYNFPGKLGAMLQTRPLPRKVATLFSTFVDLRFFINALHLSYFAVYFRWVFVSFTLFYFVGEVFFAVLDKLGVIGAVLTLLLTDFIFIFTIIYTFFSANEAYYIYKRENGGENY
jgi:hypothetical protein